MPWTEGHVPPRLRPVLSDLVQACLAQEHVRAAWLGGSLARGIGDDWSDIDLHLAVTDPDDFDTIAWVSAIMPLVMAEQIPGVPGGFIFVTPDWVHVDVILHAVDSFDQSELPARVLLDRDGVVADVRGGAITQGEPYFPAEQVRLFLYFMGNAVTVLHRGELLALSHGTAAMRDQLLVPLMLAENGIRKDDGAKRLNRYLTEEQLTALAALPPVGLDEAGLREGQRALAADYLPRARRLATRCDAVWPADLERAATELWRVELGIAL